jgi:hypothetical protein
MRVAATFAIIIAGLVLLRWVAAVTATTPTPTSARSASATGDLPSVRTQSDIQPTTEPTEEVDQRAAYDEAMRLAQDALLDDDIQTAHDFYFLAAEAVLADPDAERGVRQTQTVLGIQDRSTGWRDALDDVDDLMALAPQSPTIGLAYTEALVGAGREALEQGNAVQAQLLCSEASRRAPTRNDARLCTAQASATATAVPLITVTLQPTPTPTSTPSATPSTVTDQP